MKELKKNNELYDIVLDGISYSGYWGRIEGTVEEIMSSLLKGEELKVWDVENPEDLLGVISMTSILEAVSMVREENPDVFELYTEGTHDLLDADLLVQYAVLGEIIFG